MTRLTSIRSGLTSLRFARQGVRWTTALSAVAIALLWSLAAIFLLDFGFERLGFHTTGLQRLILVALGAAACVWAYLRLAAPLLSVSESDLEMALWVERQQGIDSDLVAALQFEASPEAPQWGSPQLENAVVDYVAEWGRGLDVFEGFDRRDMAWRGGILAISVALAGVVFAFFPGHVTAFLQRVFLLSPVHYPSETVVRQIAVNGQILGAGLGTATSGATGATPRSGPDVTRLDALAAPYGQPVDFEVVSTGVDPRSGTVQLRSTQSGLVADVELTPAGERNGQKVFTGRLPRLLDTVSYQLYLHDAWTNPAEVRLVPLPVIVPTLSVTPPAYAARLLPPDQDQHSLQLSVLEGSRIALSIEATTKPLKSARLTFPGATDQRAIELVLATDADKLPQRWVVPPTTAGSEPSPLDRVTEQFRFEIQVTDADGLALEKPLVGSIGLKADRKPQLVVDTVNKVVVPDAVPVFSIRARDDFGIREMRVLVTISRAAKRGSAEAAGSPPPGVSADPAAATSAGAAEGTEERVEPITGLVASKTPPAPGAPRRPPTPENAVAVKFPLAGEQLPIDGWFALPLAPLKLEKGDQLTLTFVAVDERGELPGESSISEPKILEVTDPSGILAAIAEGDEQSEKDLDVITKLQFGIGDGK